MDCCASDIRYKNEGLDVDQLRKRRKTQDVQLRKKKREQSYGEQRNISEQNFASENSLIEIDYHLQNGKDADKFKALRDLKHLFRYKLDDAAKSCVAKTALDLLKSTDNPQIQNDVIECFITATVLLKSYPADIFADEQGIEFCVNLLAATTYGDIRENILILITNITMTSEDLRDKVLDANIIPPLIELLNKTGCARIKLEGVRMISSLSEVFSSHQKLLPLINFIPTLFKLLQDNDDRVLIFTCQAIGHMAQGPDELVYALIEAKFCTRLVELLKTHQDCQIIYFIVLALANLSYAHEVVCQSLIDYDALPVLQEILDSEGYSLEDTQDDTINNILKNVCSIVQNMITTNASFLQTLIDAKIFQSLVKLMASGEYRVRRDAAKVFTRIDQATADQILQLVTFGCIAPLCKLLSIKDVNLLRQLLKCLQNYLRLTNQIHSDQLRHIIEECGARDNIEHFQYHQNPSIALLASDIINNFNDDNDDETLDITADQTMEVDSGIGFSSASFSAPQSPGLFDF